MFLFLYSQHWYLGTERSFHMSTAFMSQMSLVRRFSIPVEERFHRRCKNKGANPIVQASDIIDQVQPGPAKSGVVCSLLSSGEQPKSPPYCFL